MNLRVSKVFRKKMGIQLLQDLSIAFYQSPWERHHLFKYLQISSLSVSNYSRLRIAHANHHHLAQREYKSNREYSRSLRVSKMFRNSNLNSDHSIAHCEQISTSIIHKVSSIENIINKDTTFGGPMAARDLYKIKLLNWEKHNPKAKKFYKKSLIDNNFCDDGRLDVLPTSTKWLLIALILKCGDAANDTVTMSEQGLKKYLTRTEQVLNALNQLQSLQLLTYEKISFLIKEKKEKESKVKEIKPKVQIISEDATQPPKAAVSIVENTQPIIAHYCDEWKSRYNSENFPVILPHHAKLLKTLLKQVGSARATETITAYFKMPDAWFVTKRHDIPTLMGNLNAITQFLDTGRMVTRSDLKNLDQNVSTQNLLKMIDEGKI